MERLRLVKCYLFHKWERVEGETYRFKFCPICNENRGDC